MSKVQLIKTSPAIYPRHELYPHLRTFSELVGRIQDEVDDTTDEYLEQIQKCIFAAIRYCEREEFYFNEHRDFVFKTQADRGRYDSRSLSHIGTSPGISEVYLEDDRDKLSLKHVFPSEMEKLMGLRSTGRPSLYSYFDCSLFLHPVPDDIYTIRLILSPMRVDHIRVVDDLSVWYVEAFDLIRTRAKYELYRHYLKDANEANIALADFNEQLWALRNETSKRRNCDRIIPTEF